jgi:DNA repair protein RadC
MVFEKFGSLNNLMGKRLSELIKIEGIGEVKATQIAALFELTKRIIKKLETE